MLKSYMYKAGDTVKWGIAGITVLCLLAVLVIATGRWVYRVFNPGKNRIVSIVEQLQADIDKINGDQLEQIKEKGNDPSGSPKWQIDDAEVELSFIAKESSKTETKTEVVSASGGVATEQGNKLTIHLHRIHPAAVVPTTSAVPSHESHASKRPQ